MKQNDRPFIHHLEEGVQNYMQLIDKIIVISQDKITLTEIPWRLDFQNLRVACSHGHLCKVEVMLKVNRVTELCGN